jgi:hypothetical protein
MYGHAERTRVTARRAVAETLELLLSLPSLDEDQLSLIEEFTPGTASSPPARRSARHAEMTTYGGDAADNPTRKR